MIRRIGYCLLASGLLLVCLWPIIRVAPRESGSRILEATEPHSVLGSTDPVVRENRPWWVILVTIDSLRADRLAIYGYPRATTPFLSLLARDSLVFERAFAASATTVPSIASLLTALHPRQHGVLENSRALPATINSLAEVLAARGFQTGAFLAPRGHFSSTKLTKGFSYVDEEPGRVAGGVTYRSGVETAQVASAWARSQDPGQPLFLWMHLWDPHVPYRQGRESLDVELGPLPDLSYFVEEQFIDPQVFKGGAERLFDRVRHYDREVALVDDAIEELYRSIESTFARQVRPVWMITADHGEGLGGHGWGGHGLYLYNEQIRIPLLVHAPGLVPHGRSTAVAGHVDLGPTLLDLVGRPGEIINPESVGRSLFSSPVSGRGHGFVLSQRRFYSEKSRTEGVRHHPGRAPHWTGESHSLQTENFKYILHTHRRDELYDLRTDFYETENLVGTGLEAEENLRRRLIKALQDMKSPHDVPELGVEEQERLRALGYF